MYMIRIGSKKKQIAFIQQQIKKNVTFENQQLGSKNHFSFLKKKKKLMMQKQ